MKRTFPVIALIALLLISAFAAFAQTSNGTISGVVTDPSNAVVVGAKVVAKSNLTGEMREGTTNSNGAYRLESLSLGTYSITISAKGFTTTTIQNVEVKGSVVTPLNAEIKLGATSETVEVEAAAQQIQTENGELSHTISEAEVNKLPIASLNPYALATTMPGVLTVSGGTSAFTNGTSFSVNGNRPRANNFLIEGQDNNDAGIHGQGLQPANLDAVKEVSILTNSYSSEFGNGGGSVSNLIFKSGTNQFHGAAWDLLLNSSLNANDHYNNYYGIEKDKFRENIFGFSVGGPIKKDKLFFYTSYQWDKYRAGTTGSLLTLPTATGYAVLQSLLPNPRVQAYLTAIGSLRGNTGSTTNPLLSDGRAVEFKQVARTGIGANSDAPEFDVKGDYLITKNDTLNLRLIKTRYSTPYDLGNFPGQLPGFDTNQDGTAYNAGITYTKIFTPSLINELRLSYGRIGFTFALRPDTISNPLAMGPTVSISGINGYGIYAGTVPQGRFHNTYQFQDAMSWSKGNHLLKFGFDYADIRVVDTIPFNWNGTESYGSSTGRTLAGGTVIPAYSGLANFVDDFGGSNGGVAISFGSPIVHAYFKKQAYYFQDTWKLRPNFTLSYGIRYENEGAPANTLAYPTIDVNNINPANYPNRVEQKADNNNFAPRVSFAYTPGFWKGLFGDNKTVLRGGYGMFYDGLFTNILDNNASSSPNAISPSVTSTLSDTHPRGIANWSAQFTGLSPVLNPLASQTTIKSDLVLPLIHQWNLDVQRDLPGQFVLTTGYVGTRGERLYGQNWFNPFDPSTGLRIIPTRGAILVRDNSGDSIYHAMNVKLDRQFRKGLLLRTAYTWSKNIDDVSEVFTSGNFSAYPMIQNPLTRRVDRGVSAYDRRHRLVFAYVYDIPKWKPNGALSVLAHVTNDWEFSGTTSFQSGSPGNVQAGYDVNGDGITNDRPTLSNINAPLATYAWDGSWGGQPGKFCNGPQLYKGGTCSLVSASTVHWIIPAYGTNGTVGRNTYVTPGLQSWNLAVMRTIKITERHQLEFRTEMFNFLNLGNTGMPNLSLTSGVGRPYTTDSTTFGNLALTNGGSRNIRFWLKYMF